MIKKSLLALLFLVYIVNNNLLACDINRYSQRYQYPQYVTYYPAYQVNLVPNSYNYVYVPYYTYVPTIVQENRVVSIVENRLSYVPVVTGYGYYPVNNYYNPWATYRY